MNYEVLGGTDTGLFDDILELVNAGISGAAQLRSRYLDVDKAIKNAKTDLEKAQADLEYWQLVQDVAIKQAELQDRKGAEWLKKQGQLQDAAKYAVIAGGALFFGILLFKKVKK